jgi:hypothetical protein
LLTILATGDRTTRDINHQSTRRTRRMGRLSKGLRDMTWRRVRQVRRVYLGFVSG